MDAFLLCLEASRSVGDAFLLFLSSQVPDCLQSSRVMFSATKNHQQVVCEAIITGLSSWKHSSIEPLLRCRLIKSGYYMNRYSLHLLVPPISHICQKIVWKQSEMCQLQKYVRKLSEMCRICVRKLSDSKICQKSVRLELEMSQKCGRIKNCVRKLSVSDF